VVDQQVSETIENSCSRLKIEPLPG
jgi:hypothetical protein